MELPNGFDIFVVAFLPGNIASKRRSWWCFLLCWCYTTLETIEAPTRSSSAECLGQELIWRPKKGNDINPGTETQYSAYEEPFRAEASYNICTSWFAKVGCSWCAFLMTVCFIPLSNSDHDICCMDLCRGLQCCTWPMVRLQHGGQ